MNTIHLRRLAWRSGAIVLALAFMAAAWVAWMNVRGEAPLVAGVPATPATQDLIARGAYLARAGNCMGCHTITGGAEFAGGRGVETPFGVVAAPNITPDAKTVIGNRSADEFWRAPHHGRSKDGRLLYPAFPYPSFTQVSREDSDALYAFLRSVPGVDKANAPHALRVPYSTQAALGVWRALYYRPGGFEPEAWQGADWNRGKHPVQGLGTAQPATWVATCSAAHA